MHTTFPVKPSVRSFCLLVKWVSNKDNKHHPVVSELVSQWFWLPTKAWVVIAFDTYAGQPNSECCPPKPAHLSCAFSGNNSCRIWHLTSPAPTLSSEQTRTGEDTALPLLLAKATRSVGAQFELCLNWRLMPSSGIPLTELGAGLFLPLRCSRNRLRPGRAWHYIHSWQGQRDW